MARLAASRRGNVRTITLRQVEVLGTCERLWDDKVPGFCVRCQGRSKTFGLQIRIRGKQRWLTIGRWGVLTPEEARQQARVLLGRLAAGDDIAGQRERFKALPTVDELADHFLAAHVRPKLKPRTAAEYTRLLVSCIKSPGAAAERRDGRGRPSRKRKKRPRLGQLRADAVVPADVVRFHNGLADVPYEANRALAVLSTLMSFAEQHGVRPRGSNPCVGVAKFKEHRRERFLSPAEFGKIAKAMQVLGGAGRVSPFALAAIRLLILTGARREEIRTLRWSYIDAERGLAFLPDSKTGKKVLQLSAPALRLLELLPRMAGNPHVFPSGRAGSDGRPGQPVRDLQGPWEQLRTLAGFPDLRIHDLRHSYASLLAAAGTPLLIVGKLLGHHHVTTTQRYAPLSDDPVRLANERIGNQLADQLLIGFDRKATPDARKQGRAKKRDAVTTRTLR
jgi:integrase